MTYTLTLTEEEMMMIRHALCNHSTKLLTKAFEVEDELKKLGREGEEVWEYGQRDMCHKIIEKIDGEREVEA